MGDNDRSEIFGGMAGVLTSVRQQSAMNPFLWIIGILAALVIASLVIPAVPTWVIIFTVSVFTIGFIATIGVGIYFAISAPNNLRSDEYQTRRDILMHIERSQTSPEQIIETKATPNPALKDD